MRILEFQFRKAEQPLTDTWRRLPIAPRGPTLLGISFRPLQAVEFGLDARAALRELLTHPFQIIRLGAYWNQIEPEPGTFHTDDLDWQIEAAERAGKQIILCIGALKTFGYPEFFVPSHHLKEPFPEHTLIKPSAYPSLLEAAIAFITRLIERYKGHENILAWQLEHEAVDPLGIEHSWRLQAAFIEKEAEAVRKADPGRPLVMNGFLPTSLPVRISQWWQTRDQGDSLSLAMRLADMVGVDYYPRNALVRVGRRTLYLDGSHGAQEARGRKQLLDWAASHGRRLLVTEGQAEPWETVTTPPNPKSQGMYSCLPEHLITNYNAWMHPSGEESRLFAYLFWGAEYWLLREQGGDPSYLRSFTRILEHA